MFIFQVTKVAEEGSIPKSDRHKTDIYFHSPNIAVRILSSFIILKTLSRGENSAINKTDVLIQFTLGREKLGQGRTRTIKVTLQQQRRQQLSGPLKTRAARGACSCFCFVHFLFCFVRHTIVIKCVPHVQHVFFPVVFGAEAILDNKRAEGFLWCRERKRQFYWTPSTEKVVRQILENILSMILTARFLIESLAFITNFTT